MLQLNFKKNQLQYFFSSSLYTVMKKLNGFCKLWIAVNYHDMLFKERRLLSKWLVCGSFTLANIFLIWESYRYPSRKLVTFILKYEKETYCYITRYKIPLIATSFQIFQNIWKKCKHDIIGRNLWIMSTVIVGTLSRRWIINKTIRCLNSSVPQYRSATDIITQRYMFKSTSDTETRNLAA